MCGVVKVHSEEEVAKILPIAAEHGVPVTFRAAGTSLSGQAITDSVLLKLSHTGKNFRNYTVHVSVCVFPLVMHFILLHLLPTMQFAHPLCTIVECRFPWGVSTARMICLPQMSKLKSSNQMIC